MLALTADSLHVYQSKKLGMAVKRFLQPEEMCLIKNYTRESWAYTQLIHKPSLSGLHIPLVQYCVISTIHSKSRLFITLLA